MTTNEMAVAVSGAALSVTGASVSYWDRLEQISRIGASWVAIISGLVVIYLAIRNHLKNKS